MYYARYEAVLAKRLDAELDRLGINFGVFVKLLFAAYLEQGITLNPGPKEATPVA